MRRCEVVKYVVLKTGIETADVNLVVDAFLDVIKKEVGKGKRVDFRGFGCFQPKIRKAKVARDIARNKTVHIPERVEPSFKHSKKFFKVNPTANV